MRGFPLLLAYGDGLGSVAVPSHKQLNLFGLIQQISLLTQSLLQVPETLLSRSSPYGDSVAAAAALILWLCCPKGGRGTEPPQPFYQALARQGLWLQPRAWTWPQGLCAARRLGSCLLWAWKVRVVCRWALLLSAMGSLEVCRDTETAFTFGGWTVFLW